MQEPEEKINLIEEEIKKTPYHKGTEHHIGLLKAKLAKFREQLQEKSIKKGKGGGFAIPKEGDATCVLVGLPSVGKSTILAKLTAARPKIAPYPFTTLSVIPGILKYYGASIQILDVPGLVGGAAIGIGRGREVLSIARVANLLIIVAESANFEQQKKQVLLELEENGIRIDKASPKIIIKKLGSGGVKAIAGTDCGLAKNQIVSIAKELGLVNAEIQIKERINQDDLIDAILANRVYTRAIFVASKIDLAKFKKDGEVLPICAPKNLGFEDLKEKIWQKLNLIRVYLKPEDAEADFENPLILKYRSNILNAAEKISTELAENLKSAQVIRNNFKKQVSPNFQLQEGDILTFLTR